MTSFDLYYFIMSILSVSCTVTFLSTKIDFSFYVFCMIIWVTQILMTFYNIFVSRNW